MNKIHLTLITPTNRYHATDGDLVVFQHKGGEEGYMYGHVPTIVSVLPGSLRYRIPQEGSAEPIWQYFFVSSGYAEVAPDLVTIVVTAAEFASEIDTDRANCALKRAIDRAKKPNRTRRDSIHAKHAIRRAKRRLWVKRLYGHLEGGKPTKTWLEENETKEDN